MNIIMYTKTPCSYCDAAKQFFATKNLTYQDIGITGLDDLPAHHREQLKGHRTVPMIYFDDVFIGGYTDMVQSWDKKEG